MGNAAYAEVFWQWQTMNKKKARNYNVKMKNIFAMTTLCLALVANTAFAAGNIQTGTDYHFNDATMSMDIYDSASVAVIRKQNTSGPSAERRRTILAWQTPLLICRKVPRRHRQVYLLQWFAVSLG